MNHYTRIPTLLYNRFELKVVKQEGGFRPFLIGVFGMNNEHERSFIPINDSCVFKTYVEAEEYALVSLWQQLRGKGGGDGELLSPLV